MRRRRRKNRPRPAALRLAARARPALWLLACLFAAALLAGCGSGGSAATGSTAPAKPDRFVPRRIALVAPGGGKASGKAAMSAALQFELRARGLKPVGGRFQYLVMLTNARLAMPIGSWRVGRSGKLSVRADLSVTKTRYLLSIARMHLVVTKANMNRFWADYDDGESASERPSYIGEPVLAGKLEDVPGNS